MALDELLSEIINTDKKSFTKEDLIYLIKSKIKPNIQKSIESNGVLVLSESRLIVVNDVKYSLPKKQFLLVQHFVNNKNIVLTRENILRNVWPEDVFVGDRTVDVHIRHIRRTLSLECIKTRKGIGYIWDE
jgi:two-component system alkaline phosphatase synthesis response regulator PhoP